MELDIDFGKKKEQIKNSIINLFGHKVGHAGQTVSDLSQGAAGVADDMAELVELLDSQSTNDGKFLEIVCRENMCLYPFHKFFHEMSTYF